MKSHLLKKHFFQTIFITTSCLGRSGQSGMKQWCCMNPKIGHVCLRHSWWLQNKHGSKNDLVWSKKMHTMQLAQLRQFQWFLRVTTVPQLQNNLLQRGFTEPLVTLGTFFLPLSHTEFLFIDAPGTILSY